MEYCGITMEEKINELREKLKEKKTELFFTSALDEIACFFKNIINLFFKGC